MTYDASFTEVMDAWQTPPNCSAPIFPIIYSECISPQECRGFIELKHFVGDVDISRHPLYREDIIVDSASSVYKLGFIGFVYPEKLVKELSREELIQHLLPSIDFHGDAIFREKVLGENEVSVIIENVATKFAW